MRILLILAFGFGLIACTPKKEPPATLPKLDQTRPVQWQYESFLWRIPDWNEKDKFEHSVLYIPGVSTNKTYTLLEVLNRVGARGWEYIGFDGKEYLVKRQRADWPDNYFSVLREEDNPQPDGKPYRFK